MIKKTRGVCVALFRGPSPQAMVCLKTIKDRENQKKHAVSFAVAQLAFLDEKRIIPEDLGHSSDEKRYYCLGRVAGEILTVRFTYRANIIRIIGAGFWRKGKKLYEKENKIHK